MTPFEAVAHQIAREARIAANCAMPGWAYSVVPPGGPLDGEVEKRFPVRSYPTRSTVPEELVRIDLDFLDVVSDLSSFKLLLRMELEPFIIGIGKVRTEVTAKGIKVLRCDERDGIGFSHV